MNYVPITHARAAEMLRKAPDRGYGKRRKLANNTYLWEGTDGEYHVQLHSTVIILIHPDNTFTLNTGGWDTVTTKQRINQWSPARVYSQGGVWAVMHASDPRTPARTAKCRTCKGAGTVHHEAGYRHWDYSQSPAVRLDPPVETYPAADVECYRCNGSGQCDYGSKPDPYLFRDNIRVDSEGKVIPEKHVDYRLHAGKAERAEHEKHLRAKIAREARKLIKPERELWLTEHGYDPAAKTIVVFKGVNSDYVSRINDRKTFKYLPGTTVTAPDWEMTAECGQGLHFSPSPEYTNLYAVGGAHARYLACEIKVKDMVALGNKVKAKSAKVLYEVDGDGNRIESTEVSA